MYLISLFIQDVEKIQNTEDECPWLNTYLDYDKGNRKRFFSEQITMTEFHYKLNLTRRKVRYTYLLAIFVNPNQWKRTPQDLCKGVKEDTVIQVFAFTNLRHLQSSEDTTSLSGDKVQTNWAISKPEKSVNETRKVTS